MYKSRLIPWSVTQVLQKCQQRLCIYRLRLDSQTTLFFEDKHPKLFVYILQPENLNFLKLPLRKIRTLTPIITYVKLFHNLLKICIYYIPKHLKRPEKLYLNFRISISTNTPASYHQISTLLQNSLIRTGVPLVSRVATVCQVNSWGHL